MLCLLTCDNVVIRNPYSLVPVRNSSVGRRLVLLSNQTSVLSTLPETLNPENQLLHTRTYILKIPTAKIQKAVCT